MRAEAYPEEQLQECILGSKQNPIILGIPDQQLSDYCDCTLTLIVDEDENIYRASSQCGKKFFK